MLCTCCSASASSLEIRTGIVSKSVTLWTALQIPLWGKPYLVFRHKVYEIVQVLATQMRGVIEAQHQSQLVWTVQIWPGPFSPHSGSIPRELAAHSCFGLLVSCYSLLQHSGPAWLELFVSHMHTHSMNNLRWQPHWLPRLMSLPPRTESHVTDGEPEPAVSASLEKIKSIDQHFFVF